MIFNTDTTPCLYTMWIEERHEGSPSRRCVGSTYRPAGLLSETRWNAAGERRTVYFSVVDLELPSPEFAFDIPY